MIFSIHAQYYRLNFDFLNEIKHLILRKRFKWTPTHDELLLREVLNSQISMTRPGSPERGEKWQTISILLNAIECPPLASTRDLSEAGFSIFTRKENRKKEKKKEQVANLRRLLILINYWMR